MTNLRWYGDRVMREFEGLMMRNVTEAGHHLAREVKLSMQRKGRTGKKHPAYEPSLPGEPPAVQTGILRSAIGSESGKDTLGPVARVGPRTVQKGKSTKSARFLEFGTRKMKARPYLRPAVAKNKGEIARILAKT